jgi:exosortase
MAAEVSPDRGGQAALKLGAVTPIAIGLAAMATPALAILARQHWSRDSGAHQPIVIATGVWLLWRAWPSLQQAAAPGRLWLTLSVLFMGLVSYVAGTAFDFITLAVGGLYLAIIAALYSRFGGRALRTAWFPLVYLAFAVPPPSAWVDRATAPLKTLVSAASTGLLHAAGLPIARQGVTIFVGSYQLLVEDACSGMNSLFGLMAISLLYVYLRRGQAAGYSALMLALAVPIAVAANVIRIMTLILLTYVWGDAVAQSFLHLTAGILLFGVALALVFLIDARLFPFCRKLWGRAA